MRLRNACLTSLLAWSAWLPAVAQSIRFEPSDTVLDGEPVALVVEGLRAGEEVGIDATRWYASGAMPPRLFRSAVRVRADPAGRVDLRHTAPLSGSYAGIDARGLFWSMARDDATQAALHGADTRDVRVSVQRSGAAAPLSARLRLRSALPQVRSIAVDGLPGAVFAHVPGGERRPALILLGGSEGDDGIAAAAAPFASHGFAVLALPYYSPPDGNGVQAFPALPAGLVELPVETLDRAYTWLSARGDVDAARIALHGTSAGATLALLGAVHLDWVDAVVASVPSDVVFDGWGPGVAEGTRSAFSLRGRPLPFVPQMGYEAEVARAARGLDVRVRRAYERGRAARPDLAAAARIPVERFAGEVLVIGGYDDQMWPSGQMAQAIAERRLEAGKPVTALLFPEAGHLLYDTGYAPTTPRNRGARKVGGTPEADAHAQAKAWVATLQLLKRVLRPPPP
jgi:dienelactone hydrolase